MVGFYDRSVNNATAELGFLLDPRWWGKGYATEAADLAVWYGFRYLKLNRIYAHYRVSNPASGRVLAKLGMKQEGLMRQCVRMGKGFEDMVLMALLRMSGKSVPGVTGRLGRGGVGTPHLVAGLGSKSRDPRPLATDYSSLPAIPSPLATTRRPLATGRCLPTTAVCLLLLKRAVGTETAGGNA